MKFSYKILLLQLTRIFSLTTNEIIQAFIADNNPTRQMTIDFRNLRDDFGARATAVSTDADQLINQNDQLKNEVNDLKNRVLEKEKRFNDFTSKNVIVMIPILEKKLEELKKAVKEAEDGALHLPNSNKGQLEATIKDLEDKKAKLEKELATQNDITKNIEIFVEIDSQNVKLMEPEPIHEYDALERICEKDNIALKTEIDKIAAEIDELNKIFKEKDESFSEIKKKLEKNRNENENSKEFLLNLEKDKEELIPGLEKVLNELSEELLIGFEEINEKVDGLENESQEFKSHFSELKNKIEKMENKIGELVSKTYEEEDETFLMEFIELKNKDKPSEEQIYNLHGANKEYLKNLADHKKTNKMIEELISQIKSREVVYMSVFSVGTFAYGFYEVVRAFM